MENTKKISLEEFIAKKKPDIHGLNRFHDDIVALHNSGYSLKQIHEYVSLNGYKASYSSFTRWVKRHVNFEREAIETVKTEENSVKLISSLDTKTQETTPPTSESNKEKIERMKASMEKLLGGETFDEQFAALNKEKKAG